jgi:monoamine oxidase
LPDSSLTGTVPRRCRHATAVGRSVDPILASGRVAYLRPGQVLTLEAHLRQPAGRIHFAGEHASSVRGWMQGALESARRVAQQIDAR